MAIEFPLAIGLVLSTEQKPSPRGGEEILKFLRELNDRHRAGLLLIYDGTEALEDVVGLIQRSGIDCQPLPSNPSRGGKENDHELTQLQLIEAVDVVFVIRKHNADDLVASKLDDFTRAIGRSVIEFDSETGQRHGNISADISHGWLADLFDRVELTTADDLDQIAQRVDAEANKEKPKTTEWWIRLLVAEGLAAALPILWLTRRYTGMGWIHALIIFVAVLAMVVTAWWLRWRGMQKVWARSRLVAEIARSIKCTQAFSFFPAFRLLDIVPALRPLRWCKLAPVTPPSDATDAAKSYIKNRVDDQAGYFSKTQRKLETRRDALNHWTSLLLDLSLAFAIAGLVTAIFQRFAFTFAGSWLEILVAAAGVTSILALILIQTFMAIERLTYRIATCARQVEVLARARLRLQAVSSWDNLIDVVGETEHQLLQEVLDWYFTTEYAQHFSSIRPTQRRVEGVEAAPAHVPSIPGLAWIDRLVNKAGAVVAFIVRVLVGRLLWTVGACLIAALWLGFTLSNSKLQDFGEFTDVAGNRWDQGTESSHNDQGCVVIVHGMWTEPPNWRSPAQEGYWPKEMADAIDASAAAHRREAARPSVLILDWNTASTPSLADGTHFKRDPIAKSYDIGAIRAMAYRLGDLAALQIEQWISEGKINKDRPLHLIGHSAGGYAVTRCALKLQKHGFAPQRTHITILDTPVSLPIPILGLQDKELLKELPEQFPGAVDFYVSSDLVQLDRNSSPPGLHLIPIEPRSGNIPRDHSNAWRELLARVKEKGLDRATLTVRQ